MAIQSREEISKLIELGHVHRRVHTVFEIFKTERLFGRVWLRSK